MSQNKRQSLLVGCSEHPSPPPSSFTPHVVQVSRHAASPCSVLSKAGASLRRCTPCSPPPAPSQGQEPPTWHRIIMAQTRTRTDLLSEVGRVSGCRAGTYSFSTVCNVCDLGRVTSSTDAPKNSTVRQKSIPAAKGPAGDERGPESTACPLQPPRAPRPQGGAGRPCPGPRTRHPKDECPADPAS